ncbi:metallophosphoesterase [Nanoarchaeota archaeon]
MADLKTIGGYGGAGTLFAIIAIVMFSKGLPVAGIFTILIGGFLMLLFWQVISPKLPSIMERLGKRPKAPLTDEERAKERTRMKQEFDRMVQEAEKAKAAGEEIKKSRLDAVRAAGEAVKQKFVELYNRAIKKETIGETIEAIKDATPDAKKMLHDLVAELDVSKKVITRIVSSIEKEHDTIAKESESRSRKKRKKKLHGLVKRLGKDIAGYRKVMLTPDTKQKKTTLENLEKTLEDSIKEEEIERQQLTEEISQLENGCDYLARLGTRITETIGILDTAISAGQGVSSAKNYEEMKKKLNRIKTAIDKRLSPELEKRRKVTRLVSDRVGNLLDLISGVKRSELVTTRLEMQGLAADAAAEADNASRNIAELNEDIVRIAAKRDEHKQEADTLHAQLGDVSRIVNSWRTDLNEARQKAKTDPEFQKEFDHVLSNNIEQQSGLVTKLVATASSEMDNASSSKLLERKTKEQLIESERKLEEMTKEKESLEEGLKSADDEIGSLKEEIVAKLKQVKEEEQKRQQASEEAIRQEHDKRISELQADITDARQQISAAEAAKVQMNNQLGSLWDQLEESERLVNEIKPKVTEAETRADTAGKEAESLRAMVKQVIEEWDEQVAEQHKRIEELESEERRLRTENAQKAEEVRRFQTHVDEAEHLTTESQQRLEEAWRGDRDSFMGQFNAAQEERKNANEQLEKMTQEHAALADALAEKTRLSEGQKRIIADLKFQLETDVAAARLVAEQMKAAKERLEENVTNLRQDLTEMEDKKSKLEVSQVEEKESIEIGIINSLNETIKDLEVEITDRTDERDSMMKRAQDEEERARRAEQELEDITHRLEDAEREHRNDLEEQNRITQQLDIKVTRIQGEKDALEGRIRELQRVMAEKETRIKELTGRINDKDEAIMLAFTERQDVVSAKKAAEERVRATTEEIGLVKQQAADATQLADALAKHETALARLKQQMHAEKTALERQKESLFLETSALKTDIELRDKDMKTLSDNINILYPEIRKLRQENKQLALAMKDVPSLKAYAVSLEAQVADKEKELQDAKESLTATTALYHDMRERMDKTGPKILQLQARIQELEAEQAKEPPVPSLLEYFEELREKMLEGEQQVNFDAKNNQLDKAIMLCNKMLNNLNEQLKAGIRFEQTQKAWIAGFQEHIQKRLEELKKGVYTETSVTKIHEITRPKIIAIGDSHGDRDRMKNVLFQAGIIEDKDDNNPRWIAHESIKVILLGDYVDRGHETFELLDFIQRLKTAAGDNLILLIGNHEAMLLGSFDWSGYDRKPGLEPAKPGRLRRIFMRSTAEQKILEQALLQAAKEDPLANQQLLAYRLKRDEFYREIMSGLEEHGITKEVMAKELRKKKFVIHEFDILKHLLLYLLFCGQMPWVDTLLQKKDREFIRLWLRLDLLKMSWLSNDHKSVCKQLNMSWDDIIPDSRDLIYRDYKGKKVIEYLKWLRENLTISYHDSDTNILFVHAGIPYRIDIDGLPAESRPGLETANFGAVRNIVKDGYIYGNDLNKVFTDIQHALKNREMELWMSFSEQSPLFACNPNDRKLEWNLLHDFNEDMVTTWFRYSAVVFGHSQHKSIEELKVNDYKDRVRRVYNIDFGMSRAYDHRCPDHGGWLTVNDDGTITVNVVDKDDKVHRYGYNFRERQEEKTT